MAKTLHMDTTTIGYSASGITALINVIETSIEDDAKKVDPKTSKSFKTLVETLRTYWDGNDEENFEKDLEAVATTLATKLRNYKSKISTALKNYKTQFANFQKTTYAKGTVTVK